MFCHNCGNKIDPSSQYCDNCGEKRHSTSYKGLPKNSWITKINNSISERSKDISPQKVITIAILVAVIISTSYFVYTSYEQTQAKIQQTSQQLADTEAQLNSVSSSTQATLAAQGTELDQKSTEISKLQADNQLLQKVQSEAGSGSSGSMSKTLTSLAPSVVKIICNSDASGEDLQEGSGVLYHPASSQSNLWPYFVETNLHVVQTSDGSPSQCVIAIYPDYTDSYSYLAYDASGYQTYGQGVDLAYLIPTLGSDDNAGTMADLAKYAKNITPTTFCSSSNIGDHVSILGYPGVGGASLTATDGIISGYEYDDGVEFIKTSAEIEHGNSGGVAIEDLGCVLGIPTFVDQGEISSIGRILDLDVLFSNN